MLGQLDQVGAELFMDNRGAGLERFFRVDYRFERLVIDLNQIDAILRHIGIARDHYRYRLAHEARLVERQHRMERAIGDRPCAG